MAYFPHAFQKMLVAKEGFLTTAGTASIALAGGTVGLFNAQTNLSIVLSGSTSYTANPLAYLAQGSLHTTDKIGPFHGGYQESIKSKAINPKYVSKFYVSEPLAPAVDIQTITESGSLPCNTTYRLRLDIKGSPALRFLTHNAYMTVDGFTGCCTQTSGVNDPVDPTQVLLQWAWQIENSPIISQFIKPTVFNRVFTTAPGTFATASVTAGTALTFSATTNLAAGQRVILTPTATSSCTGTIAGNTFTVGTAASNTIFSVGQTLAGTGVTSGTKIVALVSGGGGTGSVFTVNISQAVASGTTITSADPIIVYIDSAWTSGAATLKAATNWYTPSATTINNVSFSGTPKVYTKVPTTRDLNNLFTYAFATGATNPTNVETTLELQGAYVDTVFSDCSFNPMDHTEFQPIDIIPTFVDYTGNACSVSNFAVKETQQGLQGRGFNETIARELILAKRYLQEPWQQDPRKREVLNDTTLSDITRNGTVSRSFSYHLLHSVPRKANPSGMFDADQYLIKIPVAARSSDFELGILTWLNAAANYDCGVAANGIQVLP